MEIEPNIIIEVEQPEEGSPEKRRQDILRTVQLLRGNLKGLNSSKPHPIPESQLKALADATYEELDALARGISKEESLVNDHEANITFTADVMNVEQEVHQDFNEGLYRAALLDYLELQAKAQELLGRSVPKEKLN